MVLYEVDATSLLRNSIIVHQLNSPEAAGKVERLNRVVDSILAEAALDKPQTLDKLNDLFGVWLDECYQSSIPAL